MDAITLVSEWNAIVQQFSLVFSEATAKTWAQIVLGWVLLRGPTTVTRIFQTLGGLADRHWTVYHSFFYRAAWSLDTLWEYLIEYVIEPMIVESGVVNSATGRLTAVLVIDDTTAARYGKHVAHAGWFKDAAAAGQATKGTVIHWADNWIIGAFTLRLANWPSMRWGLPTAFSLYRKRKDCDRKNPFRTRQQLAGIMVKTVANILPDIELRVVADGQYATRQMVLSLPENVNLVSRIRRDAAIYDLPPSPLPGQRGRPRMKGKRLPAP